MQLKNKSDGPAKWIEGRHYVAINGVTLPAKIRRAKPMSKATHVQWSLIDTSVFVAIDSGALTPIPVIGREVPLALTGRSMVTITSGAAD